MEFIVDKKINTISSFLLIFYFLYLQTIEIIYILTIFSVKKIIVFLTLLFCATSLLAKGYSGAKKFREFYESDTKNEIGAGFGFLTLYDIPTEIHDNNAFEIVNKEYTHRPTLNLYYFRKLHRRIKLGLDVTWHKTKEEYHLNEDRITDAYAEIQKIKDLEAYPEERIQNQIKTLEKDIDYWKNRSNEDVEKFLKFTVEMKLTLISRQHFALYQRYGAGPTIKSGHNNKNKGEAYTHLDYNICVSPLGFEFGGNKLRGFIEPIAVSPQGLIHGGIKYDF